MRKLLLMLILLVILGCKTTKTLEHRISVEYKPDERTKIVYTSGVSSNY